MGLGSIVGVIGIILAAAACVWYKLHTQSSEITLANSAANDAKKSQELAEVQLTQKAEQERQVLSAEIARIQEIPDIDTRRAQLLAVLVRLRGTH